MGHYFNMNILSPHLLFSSKCTFSPSTLQVVRFEKRGSFLETNVLYTHSPMSSWKMQFLPHMSSPHIQIWKIPRQKRVIFWDKCFKDTHPMLSLKMQFLSHISSPSSQMWKNSKTKVGCFSQDEHFEYTHPYVILKMQFLSHICSPSNWIWNILNKSGLFFQDEHF